MKGYIYKIINKTSDKFYIGSTLNPHNREYVHFKDLEQHRHHCIHLQRAYDKEGADNFEFVIIRERDFENENDLRLLEERYINFCWDSGKLYNVSKMGNGGDLTSYHPLLEEIKEKQRIATKMKWEAKTEEEKEAYSQKMRGRGNPNFGNKWSDEQRQHASKIKKEYFKTHDNFIKGKTLEEAYGKEKAEQIRQKMSEIASQKTGEKNPFYGKHHSEEQKKKWSEMRMGQIPADAKKVLYNDTLYNSAMECSKDIGVNYLTVTYRCRKQIYGFSYVDDEYNPREASERLTLEKCIEVAKTCKTKNELRKKQPSVTEWLKRHGYYEEVAEKYFTELRHRWTLEEMIDLAKKYPSYTEFRKNEEKAISTMSRNKWTDTIKEVWK